MAADKLQELQEERMQLANQIHELADKDELSVEERATWDRINKRYDENTTERAVIDDLKERVARDAELKQKMDKEASATRSSVDAHRQERAVLEKRESPTEAQKTRALQGYMQSLNSYGSQISLQRDNENAMSLVGFDGNNLRAAVEAGMKIHYGVSYREGTGIYSIGNGMMISRTLREGHRHLRADLGVSTEPEVIPTTLQNELSRTLLAFGGLRQLARILVTATGNTFDWATWDDTGNSGALLAEATDIGSSVAPTVAKVTFNAYKYSSKPVLISAELLMDSAFDLAAEIGAALGTRIGRATGAAYATGDGSSKPQGVATTGGSSAGKTAASATVLTGDELMDLQDSLDPAYRSDPSIAWAFNSTTLTELRKLKTSDLQYIWQPGLQDGVLDRLLGAPVGVIQDMPNTATTLIPMVYGAFSQFLIRDAGPMRLFRLEELYRATDQTGFVAFSSHDSETLQTSALKRMTMA